MENEELQPTAFDPGQQANNEALRASLTASDDLFPV